MPNPDGTPTWEEALALVFASGFGGGGSTQVRQITAAAMQEAQRRYPNDPILWASVAAIVSRELSSIPDEAPEDLINRYKSPSFIASIVQSAAMETADSRQAAQSAAFSQSFDLLFDLTPEIFMAEAKGNLTRAAELKLIHMAYKASKPQMYTQFAKWAREKGAARRRFDSLTDEHLDIEAVDAPEEAGGYDIAAFFQEVGPSFINGVEGDDPSWSTSSQGAQQSLTMKMTPWASLIIQQARWKEQYTDIRDMGIKSLSNLLSADYLPSATLPKLLKEIGSLSDSVKEQGRTRFYMDNGLDPGKVAQIDAVAALSRAFAGTDFYDVVQGQDLPNALRNIQIKAREIEAKRQQEGLNAQLQAAGMMPFPGESTAKAAARRDQDQRNAALPGQLSTSQISDLAELGLDPNNSGVIPGGTVEEVPGTATDPLQTFLQNTPAFQSLGPEGQALAQNTLSTLLAQFNQNPANKGRVDINTSLFVQAIKSGRDADLFAKGKQETLSNAQRHLSWATGNPLYTPEVLQAYQSGGIDAAMKVAGVDPNQKGTLGAMENNLREAFASAQEEGNIYESTMRGRARAEQARRWQQEEPDLVNKLQSTSDESQREQYWQKLLTGNQEKYQPLYQQYRSKVPLPGERRAGPARRV